MLQQKNQSKKGWLVLVGLAMGLTLFTVWQLWPKLVQRPQISPSELSEVIDTSPLPEIDPSSIHCSNWIKLEALEPSMRITGPAVIFPYAVPRELALALGVKWRPRWGYSILADQAVIIPESVIASETGEAVQPTGNVRYFADDINLLIAEVSHFAEECT